jgi:hypothetical protein
VVQPGAPASPSKGVKTESEQVTLVAFPGRLVLAGGNAVEPLGARLVLGGLLVLVGVYVGALRPAT